MFISPLRGSMTVEAAFVLPLFLFFFLNLFSALEMLRLHGNLQAAVWETGRQMAVYGYVYDQAAEGEAGGTLQDMGVSLLSEFAARNSVIRYLGEAYLEESPLSGGKNGLIFLESSFLRENDCVDIKVTYEVSPWVKWIGFRPFRMGNRYYGRAWTGYEVGEGSADTAVQEDIVYVTEHGSVYHETLECTYLKRTISELPPEQVESRRNASGERYRRCELCGGQEGEGKVYITEDGNRYHMSRNCGALKRTIRTLPRSDAQKRYAPCSKCGKR